jgi:hypothetical protein
MNVKALTRVLQNSIFGLMLKALLGYTGNPSLTEVMAYLLYNVMIFLGLRWMNRPVETPETRSADPQLSS